jgi:hypothetical protein
MANICKIEIECDESPLLRGTNLGDGSIWSATHTLIMYRVGIMPLSSQHICRFHGQILVEFELHAAAPSGVATIRSLAKSAA